MSIASCPSGKLRFSSGIHQLKCMVNTGLMVCNVACKNTGIKIFFPSTHQQRDLVVFIDECIFNQRIGAIGYSGNGNRKVEMEMVKSSNKCILE